MSESRDVPTSLDELDSDDTVYVATASNGRTKRRVAHWTDECEYCPEPNIDHTLETLPNVRGLCTYCTGDSTGDTADCDWSTQELLADAARRQARGDIDPLEALSQEKQARAEVSSDVSAEGAD
jgi:hypothetical protein